MFGGFFKKKDKKSKATSDDGEASEKYSGESSRSSPKASMESLSPEQQKGLGPQPVRQTSKLQKQPPGVMSPTKEGESRTTDSGQYGETASMAKQASQSLRRVTSQEADSTGPDTRETSSPTIPSSASKDLSQAPSVTSPNEASANEAKQEHWQDSYDRPNNSALAPPQRFQPKLVTDYQGQSTESPTNVSPLEEASSDAPGLMQDTSSPRDHNVSPLSPPRSPGADTGEPEATGTRAESFDSGSEALTWSDASLRSYLDEHNDIHDLFVIVHDKSNVPPAGPDHPITGSLFKEESRRLREMTKSLDDMLVDWLGRRAQKAASK